MQESSLFDESPRHFYYRDIMPRPKLLLLIAPAADPLKDLIAVTLGWMCRQANVLFDTYYAVDHGRGDLFASHGSTVIAGQHVARVARALASFDTTVVRVGHLSIFDSLLRKGASRIVEAPADLIELYGQAADLLGIERPDRRVYFDLQGTSPAAFYPACRDAMALPTGSEMSEKPINIGSDDPVLACVRRHLDTATGIDLYEPAVASHMLAWNQHTGRLILPYRNREEATVRARQMIELVGDRQSFALGRWFGDPELRPLATVPMAYNVVEPHRHILSIFSDSPTPLPQPARSWVDLEPDDQQLLTWAREKKILASWVLHSGELSHNDSVLAFLDWASMTKVRIGAGVHWQRYHFDPDVVEPLHTPAGEGGVLGLVEPVLHSSGAGIMWETAGDPLRIADLMRDSRKRIAQVAGERFAPRGVYCFADHYQQPESATPGDAQRALWQAIHRAGFEYVITSALPGPSRVLYREDDFVVLNQAGKWFEASPFVRGWPQTFAEQEQALVAADRPGWLIGAVDTPIHGCPIYAGRPFTDRDGVHPRINEFFDYIEQGGVSGRVITATPRTLARYACLLMEQQ